MSHIQQDGDLQIKLQVNLGRVVNIRITKEMVEDRPAFETAANMFEARYEVPGLARALVSLAYHLQP